MWILITIGIICGVLLIIAASGIMLPTQFTNAAESFTTFVNKQVAGESPK